MICICLSVFCSICAIHTFFMEWLDTQLLSGPCAFPHSPGEDTLAETLAPPAGKKERETHVGLWDSFLQQSSMKQHEAIPIPTTSSKGRSRSPPACPDRPDRHRDRVNRSRLGSLPTWRAANVTSRVDCRLRRERQSKWLVSGGSLDDSEACPVFGQRTPLMTRGTSKDCMSHDWAGKSWHGP